MGLKPDQDVRILQNQPGTEITPLLRGEADVAFTLEPSASTAISQGAHVVFSYPQLLGDQVFTGLMTREDYLANHRDVVVRLLRAYQRSLNELHANPAGGLTTAQKYFPQAAPNVLQAALRRLVSEQVFPRSVVIPADSWARAVAVRVKAGDLRNAVPLAEAADTSVMREAVSP
jgi:NitT/TauT family transport system substrate-binding protein